MVEVSKRDCQISDINQPVINRGEPVCAAVRVPSPRPPSPRFVLLRGGIFFFVGIGTSEYSSIGDQKSKPTHTHTPFFLTVFVFIAILSVFPKKVYIYYFIKKGTLRVSQKKNLPKNGSSVCVYCHTFLVFPKIDTRYII